MYANVIKPPTALILPLLLAAKAKRAWVEKVKLRSQWSKQKRKLPLDTQNGLDEDNETSAAINAKEQENDDEARSESSVKNKQYSGNKGPFKPQPKRRPRQVSAPVVPERRQMKPRTGKAVQESQKLRDLTRQAYSRDTLHTFKSDPLKRRKGHGGEGGRGGATGKGQPNMKLRMNALLEKIKMDIGE